MAQLQRRAGSRRHRPRPPPAPARGVLLTSGPLLAAAIGESDCEALAAGLLAQPVNAWSSTAYLAAGAVVVWRALAEPRRNRLAGTVFGLTVAAVGVGSVAFHGPQPDGARFLHDLTIAAVLAFIAIHALAARAGWSARWTLGGFAVMVTAAGALLGPWPDADAALFAVLALAAAGGEWTAARAGRRTGFGPYLTAAVVLGAGALLNLAGRTGGPLCDAGSALQLHAVWHVATAAALALWAHVALPARVGAHLSGA